MECHGARASPSDNRNAETTGEHWMQKVFEALGGHQAGLALPGEACASAAESERAAKKGIQLRGPSRNEICIAGGADRVRRFAAVKGTKGLPDKDSPMEPINKIYRFVKRFLRIHPDIERRRLQYWLNLFRLVRNEPGSPKDKAKSLILRMVSRRKIIRFRKEKA